MEKDDACSMKRGVKGASLAARPLAGKRHAEWWAP